jgi:hypothetical protein
VGKNMADIFLENTLEMLSIDLYINILLDPAVMDKFMHHYDEYQDEVFQGLKKQDLERGMENLAVALQKIPKPGRNPEEQEYITSYKNNIIKPKCENNLENVLQNKWGLLCFNYGFTAYREHADLFNNKSRNELKTDFRTKIIDLIEKEQQGEQLTNEEKTFIISYAHATINDIETFSKWQETEVYAEDYFIYNHVANNILTLNYSTPNIYIPQLLVSIIGTQKAKELEVKCIFTVVDAKDLDSTIVDNPAGTCQYDNEHKTSLIKINRDYVFGETNKTSAWNAIDTLWTIYHEIQHAAQREVMYNMDVEDECIIGWTKEVLARNYIGGDYYKNNYDNILAENDANLVGLWNAFNYLKENLPDFLSGYNEDIQYKLEHYEKGRKKNIQSDTRFRLESGALLGKDAHTLLDIIANEAITAEPDFLNLYPPLKTEYNDDGTLKSSIELVEDRNNRLKMLDEQKENLYSFFQQGQLSDQDYLTARYDLERDIKGVKETYDHLVTKNKQVPIEELVSDIFQLDEYINDNIPQEEIDFIKLTRIKQLSNFEFKDEKDIALAKATFNVLIGQKILARNNARKEMLNKKISIADWIKIEASIAPLHFHESALFENIIRHEKQKEKSIIDVVKEHLVTSKDRLLASIKTNKDKDINTTEKEAEVNGKQI